MISPLNELQNIYNKSGISILFEEYIQKATLIIGIVFSCSVMTMFFIHTYLLRMTGTKLLISVGSLSFSLTSLAAILVMIYPLYRKNEMTKKIEEGLLYSLGYMTVLSASGLGIENIMERVAEVEDNPSIKQLATKFIMNIKLFGMDITTSLEDISNRSASEVLNNIVESINNNIQTSGVLKSLFKFEVDKQMQKKRVSLTKMLSTLSYLGELYVALLIVAPILFILILTILSILGSSSFGSAALQLNLITFIGMPILAIGFIIVLDTMIGGVE